VLTTSSSSPLVAFFTLSANSTSPTLWWFFGGHTEFAFQVVFARQGVAKNAAATAMTIVSVQVFFINRLSFIEIDECPDRAESLETALIIEGRPDQGKRKVGKNFPFPSTACRIASLPERPRRVTVLQHDLPARRESLMDNPDRPI